MKRFQAQSELFHIVHNNELPPSLMSLGNKENHKSIGDTVTMNGNYFQRKEQKEYVVVEAYPTLKREGGGYTNRYLLMNGEERVWCHYNSSSCDFTEASRPIISKSLQTA